MPILSGLIGQRIGSRGNEVHLGFDLAASALQNGIVGVRRNPDRFAAHHPAATERQVDRGAIPIVELDAAARGRPDSRASITMPSPTTRETFGTSAVSATL